MSATSNSGKLTGKTAFITGAGSGMGRAMARRFAAEGAKVAATDIDEGRAAAIVEEIRGTGAAASAFAIDVADSGSVAAAVDAALSEMGRVDILCSNAGILDD